MKSNLLKRASRLCVAALSISTVTVALAEVDTLDGRIKDHYIVELKGKPLADSSSDLDAANSAVLDDEKKSFRGQASRKKLKFKEIRQFSYVMNGIAIEADEETVAELGKLPSVKTIHQEYTYYADETVEVEEETGATRETITVTNLTGVPEAHELGYTGAGVTACIADGGLDTGHPAFSGGRVIGGYDFGNDDEDYTPDDRTLGLHGTHVAGILAGNDGNMVGVAPDANLIIYKVFGGQFSGMSSTIIAAMERAVTDGCDVLNMSLGTNVGAILQKSAMATAADRLATRGVVPVISIGNAASGPFLPSLPAVAKKATAVGSAVGEYYDAALAFRVNDGDKIPFLLAYDGVVSPGVGTLELVNHGPIDCASPPAPGSYTGKAVLVKKQRNPRVFGDCLWDQVHLFKNAGAAALVWWDEPFSLTIPAFLLRWANNMVHFTEKSEIPVARIRPVDALALEALIDEGTATLAWGSHVSIPHANVEAPSFTSTWGPSYELDFKPEVMAPGESIFSTYPTRNESYGFMTGTSMASPHVAGVVALMMSANPDLKPQHVRDILMNTATPVAMGWKGVVGLAPTALQGAGMVNAMSALTAEVMAFPAKIAMGDLNGSPFHGSVTVNNTSDQDLTLDVSHSSAMTAMPPMTQFWVPSSEAAQVTFSQDQITVSAGGQASVNFTVTEPAGVLEGSVISGWINFESQETGHKVGVPYMGLKGDYHALPAESQTFTDLNPTLQAIMLRPELVPNCSAPPWIAKPSCCYTPGIPGLCGPSIGPNTAVTMDYTNESVYDDSVYMTLSQGFPMLRKFRAQIINQNGKVIGYVNEFPSGQSMKDVWNWARINGAGTGLELGIWNGMLANGEEAPSGTYHMRLEFQKLLGDGESYPDVEVWISPDITIIRP